MEKAIARNLKKLAWQIYAAHPGSIDLEAIARVSRLYAWCCFLSKFDLNTSLY